jgi:hypothetical protein
MEMVTSSGSVLPGWLTRILGCWASREVGKSKMIINTVTDRKRFVVKWLIIKRFSVKRSIDERFILKRSIVKRFIDKRFIHKWFIALIPPRNDPPL